MKENGEFQSLRRIEKVSRHITNTISANSNDPKSLFQLIDSIVSNSKENILPDRESEIELAERFNEYFMEKVFLFHKYVKGSRTTSNSYTEKIRKYQVALTHFREPSEDDAARLIQKSPRKVVHLTQYQHDS